MSSESTTQNRSVISLKYGQQRRVGIYAKLLSEPSRSPIRKFANMFQHGSPNGERLRVIVNAACLLHVTQCGGNLVGQIRRSDFGMKAFIPAVGDEVKLLIQVEAFKD